MLDERAHSSDPKPAQPRTAPLLSTAVILVATISIALLATTVQRERTTPGSLELREVRALEVPHRVRAALVTLRGELLPTSDRSSADDEQTERAPGNLTTLAEILLCEALEVETATETCDAAEAIDAFRASRDLTARPANDAGASTNVQLTDSDLWYLTELALGEEFDEGQHQPDVVRRMGYSAELRLASLQGRESAAMKRQLGRATRWLLVSTLASAIAIIGLLVAFTVFIRRLVGPGVSPPQLPRPLIHSGIYLEGVAVFCSLMAVGQVGARLAPGTAMEFVTPVVTLCSMPLVLTWPLFRGARWRHVKRDLGMHQGEGLFREFFAGMREYVFAFPIVAVGLALTLLASTLSLRLGDPTAFEHPTAVDLTSAGGLSLVVSLLFIVLYAPVFEEPIFRGALYRDIRVRFGPLVSGMLTGLVFAAIHPQGWVAIPGLAAIGMAFSTVRERRDSLIAPMAAHALHNGTIAALLLLSA